MPVKLYDPPSDFSMSYFFDDFPGLLYNSRIWSGRGGSGSLAFPTSSIGGQMRVRANASNYYELYQSLTGFSMARRLSQAWRIQLPDLTSIQSRWGLCGATSPAEAIAFGYDSAVGANWLILTITGSVSTVTDTGIAADTGWHEFRAAAYTGIVTYFIDGVPVGNITTNLPTGTLGPYCRTTSSVAATRDTLVDWIEVFGERA